MVVYLSKTYYTNKQHLICYLETEKNSRLGSKNWIYKITGLRKCHSHVFFLIIGILFSFQLEMMSHLTFRKKIKRILNYWLLVSIEYFKI